MAGLPVCGSPTIYIRTTVTPLTTPRCSLHAATTRRPLRYHTPTDRPNVTSQTTTTCERKKLAFSSRPVSSYYTPAIIVHPSTILATSPITHPLARSLSYIAFPTKRFARHIEAHPHPSSITHIRTTYRTILGTAQLSEPRPDPTTLHRTASYQRIITPCREKKSKTSFRSDASGKTSRDSSKGERSTG